MNSWKSRAVWKTFKVLRWKSETFKYSATPLRERIGSCNVRTSCLWGWQHYCSINYFVVACSIKSSKGFQIRAAGSTHWIATNIHKEQPLGWTIWTWSTRSKDSVEEKNPTQTIVLGKLHGFSAPGQWFTNVSPTDLGIRSLTVQELARTHWPMVEWAWILKEIETRLPRVLVGQTYVSRQH